MDLDEPEAVPARPDDDLSGSTPVELSAPEAVPARPDGELSGSTPVELSAPEAVPARPDGELSGSTPVELSAPEAVPVRADDLSGSTSVELSAPVPVDPPKSPTKIDGGSDAVPTILGDPEDLLDLEAMVPFLPLPTRLYVLLKFFLLSYFSHL